MKQAKDYLIFALDVPTMEAAKTYVDSLSESVGMFKVGLELFIRSGPDILKMIRSMSPAGIFLDLKLHDIPATVSRAVRVIADFGVQFVTVHCGEARENLEAAVKASQGKVGILGVTVLTSVSSRHLYEAGFKEDLSLDVSRLVMKRAAMAKEAGCAGVVCSGLEASRIRENFGNNMTLVTPGIRPAWEAQGKDDQQRVVTPAQAVQNGADYLVIGRPIRDADDPKGAAERIVKEIGKVLK